MHDELPEEDEEVWTLVIRPKSSLWDLKLAELWSYRDLLLLFVKRDFVSLYKQTILGPLWFIIQPLLTTAIFVVFFDKVAGIPTAGIPSVLFYLSGLVIWNYFSSCLTITASSFTANAQLFGKVYFPRLIVPLSKILSGLVTFGIQLLILLVFIGYHIVFRNLSFNWSPYLVSDPTKVWIGLEYFCYDTDDLWKMEDEALKQFAINEVVKIGILDSNAVSDGHVVRVPKTYPAYFGTYERFDELRSWTDSFENLFLVGRNGMHKYNNQDHSMLTAMTVVDGLVDGRVDKAALWGINTEQEYHEKK
jgi:hypothetical protein